MDTDTQRNAKIAWIVAAVLAGIAIILFFMLMNERDPRNFSDIRDQILADCGTTAEANSDNCARSLAELEGILLEIRSELGTSGTEAEVDVTATTTP